MFQAREGTRLLASLAVLFLLGFGFVVYAVPDTASFLPLSSSSTSAEASDQVNFQLVQVAATPDGLPRANASGYAGVSISGQSLSVEWSVKGALPGELLELDMEAAAINSTGASESFEIATAQVGSDGEAGSAGSANLAPGYYSIGLTVVDPSTSPHTAVLASDPSSAQVAISPSQDSRAVTQRAIGSALSYSLVPLPVYLDKEVPSGFPFREGGALIVVSGDRLEVTTSFLGAPNTQFVTVVQTAQENITAGTVTTTSIGGAVFKGNVTLSSGTYDVGLLVYVSGSATSPVAVSVPRAIQVTIPVTTPSTTTTSARSSSSFTSITESTERTTTTSSSSSPEAVHELQLIPVTAAAAPAGYLYGNGTGEFTVVGGSIYFSLVFRGQNPNTHYSLVLTVNGSSRTIGNYTTNDVGAATARAITILGAGKFGLSLSVVDTTDFEAPTTVLASVPSSFAVSVQTTPTSTSTTTSTTSTPAAENEGQRGSEWTFKLKPVEVSGAPPRYRFSTSGTATVILDARYSLLRVVLGFQDANPSTTFSAALVLNGTKVSLGSMTTNRGGEAELHSSIQVNPGTYLVGIEVYDVSDVAEFNASGPVLIMLSDPNSQLAVVVPPTAESASTSSAASSGSQGSATTAQSAVSSAVTKPATIISAGSEVEGQIHDAVTTLTIPATVQVTPLVSSTTVLDSRFSLSVGQQVGNGLVIAISGENVTGPRVLLINMSRTAPLALYPSLNVTLDGVRVAEAASALQVLNPTSSDPPRYVLIGTSASIQLLVSIPHFSLHLIQVAGELVHNVEASLALDAPLLAGSILVITLAFAAAYAARRRYFSVLL